MKYIGLFIGMSGIALMLSTLFFNYTNLGYMLVGLQVALFGTYIDNKCS